MVDNVNSLIMSKKIVLGILLSLILGILGAKASVGGFPVYPSLWLPFKCIGSGDDYWVWITTDDVDYEAKNVQFYSDTIYIEMLSNMPIKLMCLFSSVIMLYAIILLLFAHNK